MTDQSHPRKLVSAPHEGAQASESDDPYVAGVEITAAELAQIAAVLSLKEPTSTAERLFPAALRLCAAAQEWLNQRQEFVNQVREKMVMTAMWGREYRFEEAIRAVPTKGTKNGRSLLGAIRTIPALIKAIKGKGTFSPSEAEAILKSRKLLQSDVDRILENQHASNSRKTVKARAARAQARKTKSRASERTPRKRRRSSRLL